MRSRGGEGAIVKELQKAGDVRQSLYMIKEARTTLMAVANKGVDNGPVRPKKRRT